MGGCNMRTQAQEVEESPSVEAVARKQLVETVLDCSHKSMCVSDVKSVVPSGVYKWSINPIFNPYLIYSHTPLEHDNTVPFSGKFVN
jgi:hypothetical protein